MPSPTLPAVTDLDATCAQAEDAFRRGHIPRSRSLAEAALAAARAAGDRLSEARLLQLLGEVDYDVLAYPSSIAHIDAALAIRVELLGDGDLATRFTRACRAVVLDALDRKEEAAAEIDRALPPGGLPATPEEAATHARFWVALASALSAADRNAEARRILEALLAAERGGAEIEPLALANTYLHLSSVAEDASDWQRSVELTHEMLAIRRAVCGVPSLRVALGLVGLGTAQLRVGRRDEARATLLESVTMFEQSGYREHPRASNACLGLAVVEIMSGRGPSSERWITRAIELETRTFGGAHPATATLFLGAATMFAMRGHHSRAAELAQRAAAAVLPRVRTRGEQFEEAVSLAFESLRRLKKHPEIVRWLEPIIEALGREEPAPPALAPLLNLIGESYAALGKLAKAESVLRRSLQLSLDLHGAESVPMQVLYTNLAELLRRQKRVVEAEDAERRARRIRTALEEQQLGLLGRRRRGLA